MHISFEVYPPTTKNGFQEFLECCQKLEHHQPDFISVTSGALGKKPPDILDFLIKADPEIIPPLVPHITCAYGNKTEIKNLGQQLWDKGYCTLVVLKGDAPPTDDTYCQSAVELILLLKSVADFDIYVAAYPEKHPMAPSIDADIAALKTKIDAGATGLLTQFFFDTQAFFRFRDLIRQAGITLPLIAGLIPLYPRAKIIDIAQKCGTNLPDLKPASDEYRFAIDMLTHQCQELIAGGVDGLHFYCLNQAELIDQVLKNLALEHRTGVHYRFVE